MSKKNKQRRLKVLHCVAYNPQFANCAKGTIHEVIPAPPGERENNQDGAWIMGVSEPVFLMDYEFKYLD